MLRVHVDEAASAELSSNLDAIVAEGARRMLAAALEAEVGAYVSSLASEVDEHGHRLVVGLDEEPPQAPAVKEPTQSGEQCAVRRPQRRADHLATEDCHPMAEHEDLNCEFCCHGGGVGATG